MRLFVSGSAPLSAETHKEFRERTGHAILERYGMTETNMNTSNPYDGDRISGSVGLPLPGVEIRIADPETGRSLPQGEVGVIDIRGPNVFKGYWRMPEKTREEFREDGFFISGDLGRVDERGYVSIVGRAKDLIISGGFNVYPAEVEAAIEALPGIADCAVFLTRTSGKPWSRSWRPSPAQIWKKRLYRPRFRTSSRSSNNRSAFSSRVSYRATRWVRSRKRSCETGMPTSLSART
jgi:acyl-CoA synthetase (AMP-forming)/AMP-acid ligase II